MSWAEALHDVDRVFLDTAPVIYFLERHPKYYEPMAGFFRFRAERHITVVTSPITLAECLVHPINRRLEPLVAAYKRLMLEAAETHFAVIDAEAGEYASRIRVSMQIPLMDALQIAVAVTSECQAFLTNDKRLAKATDINTLVLDDCMIQG